MNLKIVCTEEMENYSLDISSHEIQKMLFIFNALEDGWSVVKEKDSFLFKKNHEEKQEYFLKSYLKTFIETNFKSKHAVICEK